MNQTGILSLLAAVGCHAVVLLGFNLSPQYQRAKQKTYLDVSLAVSIPQKERVLETQAPPSPAIPPKEPPTAIESQSVSELADPEPVRPPEPPLVVSAPTQNVEPISLPAEPKISQPQPAPLRAEASETPEPSSSPFKNAFSSEMAAETAKQVNHASRYEAIEKPYYVKRGKAEYPLESKRMKQEGVVVLALFINETGGLDKIDVVQSSGFPLLDQAAIAAERRSRFRPAHRGQHVIACKAEASYRFVLPKK